MNPVNLRYIAKILGKLILLLCSSMMVGLLWSLGDFYFNPEAVQGHDGVLIAFAAAIGVALVIGKALELVGRHSESYLGRREALLLVSTTWFLGAGISALPFWVWALQLPSSQPMSPHEFSSFVDCYFEAMSGLTTTGSTILRNVETLPNGLLLWRSFTHWLGGLGIVVIFVALLPSFGSSKKLYQTESTGLRSSQNTTIKESARWLFWIYLSLTILQVLTLKFAQPSLSWFDALVHTWGTLSSGGFSNYNASVGALEPSAQWIIAVFMLMAGVNFSLYHALCLGKAQATLA